MMRYKIVDESGQTMNNKTHILFGDGNIKMYCGRSKEFLQTTKPLIALLDTGVGDHYVGEDGVEATFTDAEGNVLENTRSEILSKLLKDGLINEKEFETIQGTETQPNE